MKKYKGLLKPKRSSALFLPLYGSKVAAGFPSPADDYIEDRLDLNELLITNRPATYLVRVSGDSMIGAAICDGDILVVDASKKPRDGSVVVASVEGEFLVKRLTKKQDGLYLCSENKAYRPISILKDSETSIVGVVVGVVRKLI